MTYFSVRAVVLVVVLLGHTACVSNVSEALSRDDGSAQMFVLSPLTQHEESKKAKVDEANETSKSNLPISIVKDEVMIALPQTSPGLDTARIVLFRKRNVLDYYAGTRWAEPLPQLVQSTLIESLENRGFAGKVDRDIGRLRAAYELVVDIRDLQMEYDVGKAMVPVAHVKMVFKLIQLQTNTVYDSFTLQRRVPSSANSLQANMVALDDAFTQVQEELVDRLGGVGDF